jgi:hypothetical protein
MSPNITQRLVQEWRRQLNIAARSSDAPRIEEDRDREHRVVGVTVWWSAWATLEPIARSEIIVDAFVEIYGAEAIVSLMEARGELPESDTVSEVRK